jgi:hypothetical protein
VAYTQAELDAIHAAKVRRLTTYEGAKRMKIADRETEFGPLDELTAAEGAAQADLRTRPKQFLGAAGKGL